MTGARAAQEGDDAGQKLAAELLRVLMATRQARLALRSVRGDQTLLDCLNSAAPQVQQSAFEALKVLYYSEAGARPHCTSEAWTSAALVAAVCTPATVAECIVEPLSRPPHCVRTRVCTPRWYAKRTHSARVRSMPIPRRQAIVCACCWICGTCRVGDKGFIEAQRAKRLGDRLAPRSHAERATEAMRHRVYASSWPILDTTAAAATSSGDVEKDAASDSDAEETAVAEAPIGPPQAPPPQVGEPSEDGSTEGEILGAVGVSADGEVKLYILETLPDEALDQVRLVNPRLPGPSPLVLLRWLHPGWATLLLTRVSVSLTFVAELHTSKWRS